jgi:thiol:disulfide interchange protein
MFAQTADENVSKPLFKILGTPIDLAKLALLFFVLLVVVFGIFMMIMYFVRRKYLPASDRKAKVIKLP